ncbi:MAG: hypothetical protein UX80_C0003G0017 [Candidatus Amesbacteria bacterium GW2011_GWA2_47_11b]|uniref:Uncharacterized protein n=2 Tax=Candidatus Amesiibacteriota TaxID=1752730 RepID=A0A0G1SL68_9BACT|nr:MAG: hypothetical protein UX80_C0003G0017 [Candidatus Amesbacteria bacterium GW2011_GWA2_47_11b]KKU70182.1 MAG: hypothetical protein UX92_C0003G0002 [Candidatus Amesbacteria bacterium GW2011_GWA1_47_20]
MRMDMMEMRSLQDGHRFPVQRETARDKVVGLLRILAYLAAGGVLVGMLRIIIR